MAFDPIQFDPISDEEARQISQSDESSSALRLRRDFSQANDYAPDDGNLFDQAILGAGQGIASLPGQAGGVASFFGATDTGRGWSGYSRQKQAEYDDLASAFGEQDPWGGVVRNISSQVAQQAPALVVGALTRSRPAMSVFSGLQSLGQVQDEAMQAYESQGLSPDEAASKSRAPAALAGLITGFLTQKFPGGTERLIEEIGKGQLNQTGLKALLRHAGVEALLEYPEEALDQLSQGVIAKYSYDPEKTWGEIFQEAHDAGALGTLVAGGTGAVPVAAEALSRLRGRSPGPSPSPVPSPEETVGARSVGQRSLPGPVAVDDSQSGPSPYAPPVDDLSGFDPITDTPIDPQNIPQQDQADGESMLRDILGEAAPTESPSRQQTVARKILTARGFDEETATALADSFVAKNGSKFDSTGEDFRKALFDHADQVGATPVDSVSAFREDEQAYTDMGFTPEEAAEHAANAKIANEVKRAEVIAKNKTAATQAPVVQESLTTEPTPVVAENATTQPERITSETGVPITADWEASTPVDGVRVAGNYDVIDASNLVTSFDKGFDQDLQPRDRSRAASQNQIATIATNLDPARLGDSPTTDMGAPIIDEKNQVLSGNGRTASIRQAYAANQGADYRAFVEQNAANYGIDPKTVAGMKNPVLVRRVGDLGGVTKEEFARQSNRQQVLGLGESEAAMNDANMLVNNPQLLDAFMPSEDGDVLGAANREFLNHFIKGTGDQAALLSKDGYNGPALQKRVKNAVLGALIGPENRQLISSLIERAEGLGIQKVVAGLMTAAPRLIKTRGGAYDITKEVSKAVGDLVRIRSEGGKVEDFLNQASLFGDPDRTAESDFILQKLDKAKSAKAVAEPLVRFVDIASRIDTTTGDMFGAAPQSKTQVLDAAYETAKAAQQIEQNLPLGKPPASGRNSQPPPDSADGGLREQASIPAKSSASAGSPEGSAATGRTASANGVEAIRGLIDRANLSEEAKFVAGKILDLASKTGLDVAALRVELSETLPGGRAGSIIGTVIRMIESADATVLPHEISHILIKLLPESDLQAIEQARIDALPDNAPPEIVAGNMTTEQFIQMRDAGKITNDYYPFINTDEFLANTFGKRFADENISNRSLVGRIKNWFKELWDAIKSKFKEPEAMDRIYKDLADGKFKLTPETSLKSEQERATFVTTAPEAANAASLAVTPEEAKIEGEDFISQSDAPTKFLEKYGTQALPNSARVALDYNNLKSIQQAGERLNGGPEDYSSIRQRSDPAHNDRRAGMAAQHAIRFESRLADVILDGMDAQAELLSTPIQRRIQKLQARFISALFHEQAFKSAQAAVKTGLNQAFDMLKGERDRDLKIAGIEGQIKNLKEVGQSRVALEQLLDDMVAVLWNTPEGRNAMMNGGTSRDIAAIYRDIKKSTRQPLQNDQLLGVASYLISNMPDLRDQLLAAKLSKNTATLGQAQSGMLGLLERLKRDPAATLEKIMREREKRAANATGAEFLFFHLQKELSSELEQLYVRMKQGEIASSIKADPSWIQYRDQVLKDQGSYVGKPGEPFQGANESIVLPGGKQVGIGSNRIVDSTAETRVALKEFADAKEILKQWLDDPANANDPTYARRELDLETLNTYHDLFLLQSGQRAPAMIWAASIMNLAVDNSGSRHAPAVKSAIGLLDRLNDRVANWMKPNTLKLAKTQRAAMKSHGFHKMESARAAEAYDQDVFQELANLHQWQQGGPKVGDRLMSGQVVTQEDLNHLAAMSQSGKDLLAIVKRHDRVVLTDERGLKPGETNYRQELTSSKFIVPRTPRFELSQSDDVKGVADSFKAYSKDETPENFAILTRHFSDLWGGVGKYFISQRSPEFARRTVFDGPEGAFQVVADEIRRNPNAYPTFDSVVNRLTHFMFNLPAVQGQSAPSSDVVRGILLREFGRIVNQWHTSASSEVENGKVVGGDPTNAFTRARGGQLAPSPFYRTGWENSDAIRSHAAAATSVALNRVSDGLKVIQSDIAGQIEALKNRATDLRSRGVAKPEETAIAAKAIEQKNGEAYSSWEKLDERYVQVTNALNRLSNAPIERTEWDKAWSRLTGGVVGSLIGNSITTLRNTSPIYMVRALRRAGYSELQSWLHGFQFSQVQAAKIIVSGLVAIPKSAWFALKGLTEAVPAGLNGKSLGEFWRVLMRDVIHELGTATPERIKAFREMRAAGIYDVPDSRAEFDNRMADLIYRGEIPSKKFTASQKAFVSAAALFENTVGAVANAIFPTIGDVGINTAMWNFEKSKYGHNAVFGRKLRARLKEWQSNQNRVFDFSNPSSPDNILSHQELGMSQRELSNLRSYFTTIGMSFDSAAADFMGRLQSDPKAEFLTEAQTNRLAESLMTTANRAAVGNRPMFFRNNPKVETFMAPLMNWPLRQLAEWSTTASIPIEGGKKVSTPEELKKARLALWGSAMAIAMLGLIVPGAVSQLRDEEIARLMKRYLYNQISQNKQPWEHDDLGDVAGNWARLSMESVPFMAITANMLLPQNTPARAAYEPSLVLLEKMKDVNNAITRMAKTGDVAGTVPELVSGFMQDAKIVTSRMDSQSGLRSRGNMIAMLKRFGPEELIRPRQNNSGVNPNINELSPYGPRLWNAAFNGDRDEFMKIYNEGIATAKEMGKKEPQRSIQQMFLSGNPYTSALKERLTPGQRQEMLGKMNETQRAQFLAAEKDFADAANWIGVSAPSLVKAPVSGQPASQRDPSTVRRYSDSIRLRDVSH